MLYKKIDVSGVTVEIASQQVQQNVIYYIKIDGTEYEVYAEGILDRKRKPNERYGEIVNLRDIKPSLDQESYSRISALIKQVMPLSYDKAKDPFIFFEYKDA